MLSRTLSVLLVVYFLFDTSHGRSYQSHFRNDYKYIDTFGSYYKFHSTPEQWHDAKRMCSEEGASLFYPENSDEANAVISLWKRSKNDAQPGTAWVFLGMSDIINEGVFETIDGKSKSEVYNYWSSEQPDNFKGDEDCVHMYEGGQLNDIPCDSKYSFICKKSFQTLDRTNNCTIQQSNLDGHKNPTYFRKDYSYIQTFGSYYKFHSTPEQWHDAKRMCSEEGASLFYPENSDEANAVISLWKRSKNDAQPGTAWVFLGMSDIINEGVFETIDGKSKSEVYNYWSSEQPDNFKGDEDCVHMYEGGQLNDIPCDSKYSFICKKSFQTLDRTNNCTIQQSNLDGQTNQTAFRMDYNYIDTFGSYYKFHSTPKQWRDANRVCFEEGASLFYPENSDEANAVISLWKRSKNDAQPGTAWVFLGMSDIITEGVFETIDGKSKSEVYNYWSSEQPDNFKGDEDCVHMYEGGQLNDIPCDSKYSFICKKSFQSLNRIDSCNRQQTNLEHRNSIYIRKDYSYIEAFGSYYKFHSTPEQWRDAKRMCSEEGASLFYPENSDEANAVISFWKRAKNDAQPGTNWVYVGMSDIITEGVHETIDGKSKSEVYNYWSSDQPDNFKGDEDCVHMYEGGQLNDIPCDSKYSFICKKSFQSLDRSYSCNIQQANLDAQRNYSYIEAVDSYYKIHTTPRTFADAKQTCVLESASLFYPEDKDEANAVIEYWKRVQPSTDWPMYLGLTDMNTEGTFATIDGRTISDVYEHWRKGEPNNHGPGDEDCVILYKQGDMNDVRCDDKFPFFCKRRQSQNWNNDCNMANLDYTFSENIGNCYKLHTTPLTWTEAYDVCRKEQSHLAVINNALEADYLTKLTKSVAKQRFGRTYQRGIYHLGVHSVPDVGWQTVTGENISDANALWSNFLSGADDNKKCGSMTSTGFLNKIDCNTLSFFICEHKIDSPTESTFSLENEENYL